MIIKAQTNNNCDSILENIISSKLPNCGTYHLNYDYVSDNNCLVHTYTPSVDWDDHDYFQLEMMVIKLLFLCTPCLNQTRG